MAERSPSSGRSTPVRISPRESSDNSFDLLTGTFPPVNGDYAFGGMGDGEGRGREGGRNAIGAGSTYATSPVQANPNRYPAMQQQQQEPMMDLLTGAFPPPTRSPPRVIVPAPVVAKQDAWKREIHAQSAAGLPCKDVFGTTASIALSSSINPFGENVGSGSAHVAYSVSAPGYVIPRVSDAATEMPGTGERSRSGSADGTFANFSSITNSISNLDFANNRSYNAGTASPHSSSSPQNRTLRTSSGSGNLFMTSSANNPKSGSSLTSYSLISTSAPDSASKLEPIAKHYSLPPGIGLERLQHTVYTKADPPRATSRDIDSNRAASPAYQSENPTKRPSFESKHYQRAPSMNISSRNQVREPVGMESRASASASKTVVHDEFVGASASRGIYKAPVRGAVHPSRPVSLELRPHPLRGATPNPVTRLSCVDNSVWAACGLGLMVWDVENATGRGCAGSENNLGDEDAAAYEFLRLQGSTTVSMAADAANKVIWTGHRDGKIRLWSTRPSSNSESRSATLVFQAHRFAVTALVITSYGELWAGFESGELKAWPCEVLMKAISGVGDGASYMEKTHVELRIRNLGVGPNGPLSPEVRFLVGDHAYGRVWCGGAQYIALWDARSRDLLRMFGGPSGQTDLSNLDNGSHGKESLLDEDLKVGYAKVSGKKEKGGWLQRSRNAVMGAADAVRRAASGGGQGGDDGRRLEALVAAADGTMWGGYGSGLLVQWDWQGNRLQEISHRSKVIRSMCPVGNRLWVGYADGKLQVLNSGNALALIGSWQAHRLAVIQMAVCDEYVFSLGLNGSIRGWNVASPDRNLEVKLKETMSRRADSYTRQRHLLVLAATWNTAQERATVPSVRTWLGFPGSEASIVVVGLQEVEMGAGAIGMAAVKETVGMGLQEKGSQTGQWWLGQIDGALGEGKDFERVGNRQLAGMLVGVWVRRKLLPYVGEVEAGAVACGFGRALGNKGAVGVKMMIFRRTICVLTCHLAAHMEHVSRRNADFEHIYNQMSFGRAMRINVTAAAAGVSNAVQNMLRGGNGRRTSLIVEQDYIDRDGPLSPDSDPTGDDTPELGEADLLIWTGDLNYRIDNLTYEETLSLIRNNSYETLLSADQLRIEMASGRTFHGMREGHIKFPPTYKFDKGTHVYDTSEKRRIPAWCDRVLFRDSFDNGTDTSRGIKLTRPIKATVVGYDAIMDLQESDHKPVRCLLNVDLSVIDESARRREYGEVMRDTAIEDCLASLGYTPETTLNTNRILLDDSQTSMLVLKNSDRLQRVLYLVHCEGLPSRGPCPCGEHSTNNSDQRDAGFKGGFTRPGYGFPLWLTVLPAAGVVGPNDSAGIRIKHVLTPSSELQDKVAVLVVRWKGSLSSKYRQHRVCVCHRPSIRTLGKEKESPRIRSQDQQRRPVSREKEPEIYNARSDHASSSFTQSTPDLLL